MVCTQSERLEFTKALDDAIAPMKWVHSIEYSKQDFLDLSIHASLLENFVCSNFSMCRKPSFRPHYLASISNHLKAHKLGIYFGEANRALICCSNATWYHDCMQVAKFVAACGYPSPVPSAFDCNKRKQLLQKNESRNRPNSTSCPRDDNGQFVVQSLALATSGGAEVKLLDRSTLYYVLPYSSQAKQLKISSVSSFFSELVPVNIKVAWSVKPNTFRRLAALIKLAVLMQCMGLGWWDIFCELACSPTNHALSADDCFLLCVS